jgi:GNAT superfamily N-acetyltransferase
MGALTGGQGRPPRLSAPVPINARHDLGGFDCGDPVLDSWLKERALRNESRFSRTYVVCERESVIAFYCLAAGAVDRSAAPGRIRRNAPEAIPVAVIGRLAVGREWAGRGIGADMLADALRRAGAASLGIGIRAVLVQAKDEKVRRFYLACAEFTEFPAGTRTLFLPIETVAGALP